MKVNDAHLLPPMIQLKVIINYNVINIGLFFSTY